MAPKQISVSYESKVTGKQQFHMRSFGGSIICDLEAGEDIRSAYHRAWLIIASEVIGRQQLAGFTTPEEDEQKKKRTS